MTRERLEELIKQGATIYPLSQWFDEISLNKIGDVEVRACYYGYELGFVTDQSYAIDIELLFETKEERNHIVESKEWKHKTYAARTERFEPPMWEEIKDTYEFHFTCQNYTHKRTDGIIETVYTPQCFMFYVHKSEQPNYNRVMIRNYRVYALNIEVFDEPATKENYEKACEIVRGLFSGNNG